MTSRERVLAAVNHQEPDRVPVDFGATPSSGISAIAYSNLIHHLDYKDQTTRVYDVVQQLAEPSDTVLEHFNVDVIDIGRAFNTNPDEWHEMTLQNGRSGQYPKWFRPVLKADKSWYAPDKTGQEIAKMPAFATFFDQLYFPYLDDILITSKNYRSLWTNPCGRLLPQHHGIRQIRMISGRSLEKRYCNSGKPQIKLS